MTFAYLAALLIALTGMVLLDRRFPCSSGRTPAAPPSCSRSASCSSSLWDLAGVGLGVFFRGETPFMTGIQIAPGDPARGGLLPRPALLPHDEPLRRRGQVLEAEGPAMTYWLLNAGFLAAVAVLVIAAIATRRAPRWAAVGARRRDPPRHHRDLRQRDDRRRSRRLRPGAHQRRQHRRRADRGLRLRDRRRRRAPGPVDAARTAPEAASDDPRPAASRAGRSAG